MAFALSSDNRGPIRVIVHLDSAVGCDEEGYKAYLESFGEPDGPAVEHLKLKDGVEPTYFILRRTISYERKQAIRSKNIKVQNDDVLMDINYSADLLRVALIDIENPPSVPETQHIRFKRGKDGLCDTELMNKLDDAGVTGDLTAAYSKATAKAEKDKEKVKN